MDNEGLKKAGLKVTGPRLKILHILENSDQHHLSAEEIYRILVDSGEEVGLATVYRVLTQFESAGLVTRHNFTEGYSMFELSQAEHHDHIVCTECGIVEEFADDLIEKRQKDIAMRHGFKITDHVLNLYGVCASCQR